MIYISTEKINHCANLEYTNLEFHVAVIIYDNNLLFIPNWLIRMIICKISATGNLEIKTNNTSK